MTADEYIKKRVEDQIAWYDAKAKSNKRYHLWMKGLIIILSASIPFLSSIDVSNPEIKNVIFAGLGASITILSGISGLLKFHEKWTKYRTTSQALTGEKILYSTKAGHYSNPSVSFANFVENVEGIINNECKEWGQYISGQTKTDEMMNEEEMIRKHVDKSSKTWQHPSPETGKNGDLDNNPEPK